MCPGASRGAGVPEHSLRGTSSASSESSSEPRRARRHQHVRGRGGRPRFGDRQLVTCAARKAQRSSRVTPRRTMWRACLPLTCVQASPSILTFSSASGSPLLKIAAYHGNAISRRLLQVEGDPCLRRILPPKHEAITPELGSIRG